MAATNGHDASRAKPAAAAGDGETILIVEDDDAIRSLVRTILQTRGYNVLEAADGDTALKLCAVSNELHLLLTDLTMPGLDGRELARRVHRARPALKIALLTGYPRSRALDPDLIEAGVEAIEKPFTGDGLAAAIRQCLDT